ncbi:VOC family protein [Phenylobacterium sp.]|uniref:VOC family protein n=1 Tax=Phenylobacterium sp. TaxID=1871053 RepID=UPI002737B0EA|nr:VOC family protein [Phenylobacterium sp.]MDP3867018.1 VOC family protein [Phenylobacterium sp.]
MARIREIVVDSLHPAALARFWAGVLEGYEVRAYDAAEIARLAGLGLTPETDPSVMVDGPGPMLCFQQVATLTPGRRMHLDIVGGPRREEVARIVALGGTVRDTHDTHTVMLDPEGAAFCVQDTRE